MLKTLVISKIRDVPTVPARLCGNSEDYPFLEQRTKTIFLIGELLVMMIGALVDQHANKGSRC